MIREMDQWLAHYAALAAEKYPKLILLIPAQAPPEA